MLLLPSPSDVASRALATCPLALLKLLKCIYRTILVHIVSKLALPSMVWVPAGTAKSRAHPQAPAVGASSDSEPSIRDPSIRGYIISWGDSSADEDSASAEVIACTDTVGASHTASDSASTAQPRASTTHTVDAILGAGSVVSSHAVSDDALTNRLFPNSSWDQVHSPLQRPAHRRSVVLTQLDHPYVPYRSEVLQVR